MFDASHEVALLSSPSHLYPRWERLEVFHRDPRNRRGPAVVPATGSALVGALEAAYEAVRDAFDELPAVVLVTGSGLSAAGLKWGHFGYDRWRDALEAGRKPELFIGGEALGMGARHVMTVLLHECAHGLAMVREIKDTSRGYRYHNRRFVAIANELGLDYQHDAPHPSIGFSDVSLTEAGSARWAETIGALERAIRLSMAAPDFGGLGGGLGLPGGDGGRVRGRGRTGGGPSRSLMRFTCECDEPRIIRMAPRVYELDPPFCKLCDSDFA